MGKNFVTTIRNRKHLIIDEHHFKGREQNETDD